MNKKIFMLFLMLFISYGVFFHPPETPAADTYAVTSSILDSAETFFISLKKKNYGAAWDLLSSESQETIINNIFKASKNIGENIGKEAIKNDFRQRGAIFKSYWDAFLTEFDPDIVLNKSQWEMGQIEKTKAEIMIIYEKSEHPAILHMFKENKSWKVGFLESISGRISSFYKEYL